MMCNSCERQLEDEEGIVILKAIIGVKYYHPKLILEVYCEKCWNAKKGYKKRRLLIPSSNAPPFDNIKTPHEETVLPSPDPEKADSMAYTG